MPSLSLGLNSYINAASYLFTVILAVGVMSHGMERRNAFVWRAVGMVTAMLVVTELFTLAVQAIYAHALEKADYIIYIQTFKYFCIFVLSGVGATVCYKCSAWHGLFFATSGYCLQHMAAKIAAVFTDIVLPPMHWAGVTALGFSVSVIFSAAFYCLFGKRARLNYKLIITNRTQVAIAACVVGVTIIYNSFGMSYISALIMTVGDAPKAASLGKLAMLFVHVMSFLTAFLALMLDLAMCRSNSVSAERDALERMLSDSKRQYEYEKRNIETINIKCHDLKHQLAAMKGKIYEEQIQELAEAIDFYDADIKTGNDALDVVLTQKSFYCTQHGIRLTCLIDGSHFGFIARHELYAMFGNAIDNAIEAVEKLIENKRVISVTEKATGGFISVRVENYYDGDIRMENGMPLTDKNGDGHGYGVKSIKMIAEKYNGGVAVSARDGMFALDIFLNDPQAK